jgi:hypothetical protein
MPLYQCKALDRDGVLHETITETGRLEAVADLLSGQGYIPVLTEKVMTANN